ncbi:uncharacterized protein LOC134815869 [Bolinopsis microptera]|uniref:uncharacterized protein LOC134815869 n=1 Tax=Bolinopsis microptera TaxID=2820187 RepID=UPI003079B37A
MYVYWKLIFGEDAYLFGGDYSYEDYNTTDYPDYPDYPEYPGYDYTLTDSEKALNYITAILFVAFFLLSTLLNPLLFYYYDLSESKANRLFKLLAASDFITNLFAPVYAVLMFSPKLYSGSSTILLHVRPIVCVFGCFSQIFTAVLAITRLLSIIMPFLHLRQKYIFGYIMIHILYMIVANMTYYGIDAFYAKEDLTELLVSVMNIMEDVCFWSYFLHCMVGVVASIVTFLFLLVERGRNPATAEKYLRSSITLLLMNLPYIITMVLIGGIQWSAAWGLNSREIVFAWVPIFTSALDPVIVIARKKEVMEKVAAAVRSKEGHSVSGTRSTMLSQQV